jgi:DNA-binding GntR family transcriptional regulator
MTPGARIDASARIDGSDGTEGRIELPRRGYLADELYEYLRTEILVGRLRPQARLVEASLARRARISRTPVREALHRLEADGLVASLGRSVTVVDVSSSQLSELCTAREGMEGFAARLAARGASELALDVLATLLDLQRAAVESEDVEQQVDLNHRFHETIWQSAHNSYLARHLDTLRRLIERGRDTTLKIPGRQLGSLMEHTAIVEALRRRDPDAAEAATKNHFRRAMATRQINERAQSTGALRSDPTVAVVSHGGSTGPGPGSAPAGGISQSPPTSDSMPGVTGVVKDSGAF